MLALFLSIYAILLSQVKVADLKYDSGLPKVNLYKENYLYLAGSMFWVFTVIHLFIYQLKVKINNYEFLEYECAKVFAFRIIASTLFMYLYGYLDVYLKINYRINDLLYITVFLIICYYLNMNALKFTKTLEKKNNIKPSEKSEKGFFSNLFL